MIVYFSFRFQESLRNKLLKMLQEEQENNATNAHWQEDLAKDSQRIAKAGSFRMALIQYLKISILRIRGVHF